ncbi:hypothetical protein G5B35_19640 [Parapusillimonas sp. SGNA-6]|nr:hypothetical protein [Parapusillimonas sp. SGNA-6]
MLLIAMTLWNGVYGQQSQKVTEKRLSIGMQSQRSPYGSFVDLQAGMVYNLKDAGNHQQDIDLVFGYSKVSAMNIMAPSSKSLKSFKLYRENVLSEWQYKNRGVLVVLKGGEKNREIFEGIKTDGELRDAFEEWTKPSGRKSSDRIEDVSVGDYILFRSNQKEMYAVGYIADFQAKEGAEYQGHVLIDFKISGR